MIAPQTREYSGEVDFLHARSGVGNRRTQEEFIPSLELQGSNYEIGRQHGILLREAVHDNWKFYREKIFTAVSEEQLKYLSETFLEATRTQFPRYYEELSGIAEGSGLALWKIMALNSRTEIERTARPECTVFFDKQEALLFQNWDWAEESRGLVAALRIHSPLGQSVTFTEAGMLAKIGLNQHGLGVALSRLRSDSAIGGPPCHILLRACLDCHSITEAETLLFTSGCKTTNHVLIADQFGNYRSIEMAGEEIIALPAALVETAKGHVVHTNHYLAKLRLAHGSEYPDTMERFAAGKAAIDEYAHISLAEAFQVMRHSRVYINPVEERGVYWGTIASIALDLRNSSMLVSMGAETESVQRISV